MPEGIRHASEFFDQFGIFVHITRPGDLVFFSKEGMAPKHMGILINEIEYVHSPGKDDTRVLVAKIKKEDIPDSSPNQIYRKNPIGYKSLAVPNGRWQQII